MAPTTKKIEIPLVGLAVPWDRATYVSYGFPRRFARGAFSEWIRTADPFSAKVKLEHCTVLPTVRGVRFVETRQGLECRFCLRPGHSQIVDDTLLALRHGHFAGLSVGIREKRINLDCRDAQGHRIAMVMEAEIGEVSLAGKPLFGRHTPLNFRFFDRPQTPIEPKTEAEAERLEAFFAQIGYRKPFISTRKPPDKKSSAPKPWKPSSRLILETAKTLRTLIPPF